VKPVLVVEQDQRPEEVSVKLRRQKSLLNPVVELQAFFRLVSAGLAGQRVKEEDKRGVLVQSRSAHKDRLGLVGDVRGGPLQEEGDGG